MADGIKRRKLSDYKPDPANANQGTERGQYMLDHSVETVGLGRSIVATADDTIAAGKHILQAAADAGLDDVLEIETDGKTLVVVKRRDWESMSNPQARRYAYLDNRTSEVGLRWDVEQLLSDMQSGINLDDMFFDWELDKILGKATDEPFDLNQEWEGMPEFEQENIKPFHSIKVHFKTLEDLQAFAALMGQTVTENTTYIYYPKSEHENLKQYGVIDES